MTVPIAASPGRSGFGPNIRQGPWSIRASPVREKEWRARMNRMFEPRGYFTVPDGTEVSPFLNATDTNQSDVPWDALGDMSIAAGRIKPGVTSWIHCHPVLVQVTYVVSGQLTVHMKGPGDASPYRRDLQKGQAVVTSPDTWFQLQNSGTVPPEVLYIVSP